MFGSKHGFFKGLIIGTAIGSAAYMMVEPPSKSLMRKMRKKALCCVHDIGCAMGDMMSGR